jgi:hypothetical protein
LELFLENGRNLMRPTRSNGCVGRPDPLQVVSWVALPLFLTSFALLSIPPFPAVAQTALAVVYGVLTVVLLVVAGKTTLSDPSDPEVRAALSCAPNRRGQSGLGLGLGLGGGLGGGGLGGGGGAAAGVPPRLRGYKKCYVCKVYRRPLTEHCRVCNTCVETFDHHCKWLNNCVGSQNYRLFSATLHLTTLHMLVHTLVAASALVAYSVSYRVKGEVDTVRIVLQSVSLVFSIAFEALLLQLWYFHIGLIRDDNTTFEIGMGRTRATRRNDKQTGGGSSSSVFPAQDISENARNVTTRTSRPSFCAAFVFPLNPKMSRATTKMPPLMAAELVNAQEGGKKRASDANAADQGLRPAEAP